MDWEPLSIEGAWKVTPAVHGDDRGWFMEMFKLEAFEDAVGHSFSAPQVNVSNSAAGVVRGIHFSQLPISQAKYVTCLGGAILDVVVDIRVGSPTFGKYESVLLDSRSPRTLYISEGLGHAFMALEDNSTVCYMVSSGYAPGREFGVFPLDEEVGIEWPTENGNGDPITPILSPKDLAAPTLTEALEEGLLPVYDQVVAFRESLRA